MRRLTLHPWHQMNAEEVGCSGVPTFLEEGVYYHNIINITVKLQGERLLVGFRIQEVDLAHLRVWTEPADSTEAWCTCSTMYLSGNAHQHRLGCTS